LRIFIGRELTYQDETNGEGFLGLALDSRRKASRRFKGARFGLRADPRLWLGGVPPELFLVLPFYKVIPEGRVDYHPAFFEVGDEPRWLKSSGRSIVAFRSRERIPATKNALSRERKATMGWVEEPKDKHCNANGFPGGQSRRAFLACS
jgi:hypothetical protein